MPVSETWLTDVAERVDDDWPRLAIALGLSEADVAHIGGTIDAGTQAHATINSWLCSADRPPTHDQLQRALRLIGRDDVVAQCMPPAPGTDNAPVRPLPSTTSRTSFDSCTCRLQHDDASISANYVVCPYVPAGRSTPYFESKRSAVAEMGDRARAKWTEKWGAAVPLFVGGRSWVPI